MLKVSEQERAMWRAMLRRVLPLLVLFIGTFLLYSPILNYGFINYDDPDYILNNPHVNAGLTWPGIVWAFTHTYAANWHPLTWISHMADCQIFGLKAAGHHLINVVIHCVNAVLLFAVLRNMTGAKWRSFFVAALFAWHPLHVESVAWASERKDVLSGFFWMLTLLCYAIYAKGRRGPTSFSSRPPPSAPKPEIGGSSLSPATMKPGTGGARWNPANLPEAVQPRFDAQAAAADAPLSRDPQSAIVRARPAFYWLALFFFACGLMSKPMVVTLPCVLLLLDFWPLQRWTKGTQETQGTQATFQRLIIEKIPFFALSAASCAITLLAQHNAMWSTASLPFSFRFANTLMAYVRYLSKIFLPTNLALIYPYPHSWPLAGVVAAGAVLLALTVVFVLQARRFPYLAVGWFWFLGTLVPVIGLVQVGVQSMADRYTYLPSIGIFILATWGISDLLVSSPRRIETCAIAGGCVLIACLVLTSIQIRYWRDDISLFTHTVLATSSDNYAAYDCLGKSWQQHGNLDRAKICYEQAVQSEPDYPLAQFDLGMNLVATGDPAGASNHMATAVQLWPGNAVIQYDYGVFLSRHGQLPEAASHLKAALAIQPDFPEARKELEALER